MNRLTLFLISFLGSTFSLFSSPNLTVVLDSFDPPIQQQYAFTEKIIEETNSQQLIILINTPADHLSLASKKEREEMWNLMLENLSTKLPIQFYPAPKQDVITWIKDKLKLKEEEQIHLIISEQEHERYLADRKKNVNLIPLSANLPFSLYELNENTQKYLISKHLYPSPNPSQAKLKLSYMKEKVFLFFNRIQLLRHDLDLPTSPIRYEVLQSRNAHEEYLIHTIIEQNQLKKKNSKSFYKEAVFLFQQNLFNALYMDYLFRLKQLKATIALYRDPFDPPTGHHLNTIQEILDDYPMEKLYLEPLIYVPDNHDASFLERKEMVEKLIKHLPKERQSKVEIIVHLPKQELAKLEELNKKHTSKLHIFEELNPNALHLDLPFYQFSTLSPEKITTKIPKKVLEYIQNNQLYRESPPSKKMQRVEKEFILSSKEKFEKDLINLEIPPFSSKQSPKARLEHIKKWLILNNDLTYKQSIELIKINE